MTLEELKEKRKEIDREIRRLQNMDFLQCGGVKFDRVHYPTRDEYKVHVKCETPENARWSCIALSTKKQEAIEKIPEIIKDLNDLYNALRAREE